jgi:zinc transport system substrate-binding protein
MKKTLMKTCVLMLSCLLVLAGAAAILCGCGEAQNPPPAEDGSVSVVCTNFAGYDFVRSLRAHFAAQGGESTVEITLLGKPGQDMHSYEPAAKDIMTLAGADILVCTGAESWLDAAIASSGNKNVIRVSMMAVCDTMDSEHDHDHDHDHGDDSCELIGQDEHVWLSVANADRICTAIAEAFRSADAEHIELWQAAQHRYGAELMSLLGEYTDMMKTAVRRNVVVADRHPFAYLFRELGLECLAAFPGCSSETSASFQTQMKLIEHTKEWALPYIFVMEGSDGKVAEVVAQETGAQILTLNSMQVVTDYDMTYIGIMKQNLENLKKALG